ncbi:hypothetical protein BN1182_AW_00350 [Pantoea ananatis]|nr:hypothetical protein BN1182_AW_00350 [Pantoea ananatis]CRH33206.1 hypothetical protein BN1183_AR_00350 [Pantoea ananatis]
MFCDSNRGAVQASVVPFLAALFAALFRLAPENYIRERCHPSPAK